MSDEATSRCSNCQAQIAESKLMLHELYCERNCKRCETCGKFFDMNDIQQHEEDFHKNLVQPQKPIQPKIQASQPSNQQQDKKPEQPVTKQPVIQIVQQSRPDSKYQKNEEIVTQNTQQSRPDSRYQKKEEYIAPQFKQQADYKRDAPTQGINYGAKSSLDQKTKIDVVQEPRSKYQGTDNYYENKVNVVQDQRAQNQFNQNQITQDQRKPTPNYGSQDQGGSNYVAQDQKKSTSNYGNQDYNNQNYGAQEQKKTTYGTQDYGAIDQKSKGYGAAKDNISKDQGANYEKIYQPVQSREYLKKEQLVDKKYEAQSRDYNGNQPIKSQNQSQYVQDKYTKPQPEKVPLQDYKKPTESVQDNYNKPKVSDNRRKDDNSPKPVSSFTRSSTQNQQQNPPSRTQATRPDTAIARDIQAQMNHNFNHDDFGMTEEELQEQRMVQESWEHSQRQNKDNQKSRQPQQPTSKPAQSYQRPEQQKPKNQQNNQETYFDDEEIMQEMLRLSQKEK